MPSTALPVQHLLLSHFHKTFHRTLLHPDRHGLVTKTCAVAKAALKLAKNWPRLQTSVKLCTQCIVVYSTLGLKSFTPDKHPPVIISVCFLSKQVGLIGSTLPCFLQMIAAHSCTPNRWFTGRALTL